MQGNDGRTHGNRSWVFRSIADQKERIVSGSCHAARAEEKVAIDGQLQVGIIAEFVHGSKYAWATVGPQGESVNTSQSVHDVDGRASGFGIDSDGTKSRGRRWGLTALSSVTVQIRTRVEGAVGDDEQSIGRTIVGHRSYGTADRCWPRYGVLHETGHGKQSDRAGIVGEKNAFVRDIGRERRQVVDIGSAHGQWKLIHRRTEFPLSDQLAKVETPLRAIQQENKQRTSRWIVDRVDNGHVTRGGKDRRLGILSIVFQRL